MTSIKKKTRMVFDGEVTADWLEGFDLRFNGMEIPIRCLGSDLDGHPFFPQDEVQVIIRKKKKGRRRND